MKQHGIAPTGNTGGGSGVKKEAKDPAKEAAKSRKKRKLDKVEDDVGDVDEPIKGEVKHEDATTTAVKSELDKSEAAACVKRESVKVEQQSSSSGLGLGVVPVSTAVPAAAPPGTSSSVSSSSLAGATNSQNNDDDDDDEVLIVSATDRPDNNANVPGFGSGSTNHQNPHLHHHHSHAHAHAHAHPHSPMPMPNGIPGIHSFDYGTNMGFPPQTPPPMMSRATSNSFPYGFNTSPWFHPHDNTAAYGHFWQGMSTPEPQHQHQHQHQQQHNGSDHGTGMDG